MVSLLHPGPVLSPCPVTCLEPLPEPSEVGLLLDSLWREEGEAWRDCISWLKSYSRAAGEPGPPPGRLVRLSWPGLWAAGGGEGSSSSSVWTSPRLPLPAPAPPLPAHPAHPQPPGEETLQPRASCNQATVPRRCFSSPLLLPYSISSRPAQLPGVSPESP